MRDKDLTEIVYRKKEVFVFGHGVIGDYIYTVLKKNVPMCEIYMCDSDAKKQGEWNNTIVFDTEYAVNNFPNISFLVCSVQHKKEQEEMLLALGVDQKNIIHADTDESLEVYEQNLFETKRRPLKRLQFEVDIAMHCNLNCACCSQFSCLAEPEFIDLAIMERDLQRLGKLFRGDAERIFLIGGEPLLHPLISECMQVARRYFPKGDIFIYTNGLLLLQQSQNFWRTCRENEIALILTKYPIAIPYDAIVRKAQEEDVNLLFYNSLQQEKEMNTLDLDPSGKQDIEYSFTHCYEANNCIKLKDGKMYTCTRPAAIYKFNEYFNQNLSACSEDYVDIFEDITADKILEHLAKPIPFCRFCNKKEKIRSYKWHPTQKKIEEFVCSGHI